MEVVLKRKIKNEKFTLGEFLIGGNKFYSLEDPVRKLPTECPYTSKGLPCKCPEKIYGETAIPEGRYELRWSYSPAFGIYMPEIVDVPHFQGIRLHWGNYVKDTKGCPLIGMTKDDKNGNVWRTKEARDIYYPIIKSVCETEKMYITIC